MRPAVWVVWRDFSRDAQSLLGFEWFDFSQEGTKLLWHIGLNFLWGAISSIFLWSVGEDLSVEIHVLPFQAGAVLDAQTEMKAVLYHPFPVGVADQQ